MRSAPCLSHRSRRPCRKPSGASLMPPSPWIGSTRTAARCGPTHALAAPPCPARADAVAGFGGGGGRADGGGDQRAEGLLVGGLTSSGEAAVSAAVEGLGKGQNLVFVRAVLVIGVLADQLDRGLHRLGAGVAEEDLVEVRCFGEHLGDLGLQGDLVQVRAVYELPRLLLDRLNQTWVAVA